MVGFFMRVKKPSGVGSTLGRDQSFVARTNEMNCKAAFPVDQVSQYIDADTGELFMASSEWVKTQIKSGNFIPLNSQETSHRNLRKSASPLAGKRNFAPVWARVDMDGSKAIARKEMTGAQGRILFYLMSASKYGNKVMSELKDISSELDVSVTHVSRMVKEMDELDILVRIGNGVLMLNPAHILVGETIGRSRLIAEYYSIRNRRIKKPKRKAAARKPKLEIVKQAHFGGP